MTYSISGNSKQSYKETITVRKDNKIVFDIINDQGSFSPSHWHEAIEIVYILEGYTTFTIFERSINLTAGQFILINSSLVHAARSPEKNRALLMQIPDDFLSFYLPDISMLWFAIDFDSTDINVQKDIQKLNRLLLSMKDLQEQAAPGYLLRFQSELFSFLDLLYQKFLREIPGDYQPKSSRILSRLDAVVAYTQQNYASPISLREAAKVAALQPEYFCRFFRQNMGVTYLQFLNDFRLSKIYRDLLITELSVQQLQEIHGFTNAKLFHRLFRERFHTTPLKVRKQHNLDRISGSG